MTSNDAEKTKKHDSDLSLKQEDCPLLTSSPICSSRSQLQGTSGHPCTDPVESNTFDQHGTSFLGLRPPPASSESVDRTGYPSKMLKGEKYKSTVLDTADYSGSKDAMRTRRGHWSHLYQLVDESKCSLEDPVSRAKDKLMICARENSRGNTGAWNLGRLRINNTDGKAPTSEAALLPPDAKLNILSTSSFSLFFGKKTSKGKEVIHGHPEDKINLDNVRNLQSKGRLLSSPGLTSGAQREFLQHRSVGLPFYPNHDGISLREWLNPGNSTKDKVECLSLFRQIAEFVNLSHSQGLVLQELRPSYVTLVTSNKLKYIGSSTQANLDSNMSQAVCKKRSQEDDIHAFRISGMKQQKLITDMNSENNSSASPSRSELRIIMLQDAANYDRGCSYGADYNQHRILSRTEQQDTGIEKSLLFDFHLEEKWYSCPEELGGSGCTFSSNIYSLGVLLFELLCPFDSLEAHSAAMCDLQYRILPPFFLSESPKEAGLCLWLIHPEPSSRPTIRDILLSDLFCGTQDLHSSDELLTFANDDAVAESELLLDFLVSSKEQKQDRAVKLVEDIRCIEADIKGLGGSPFSLASPVPVKKDYNLQDFLKSVTRSSGNEARLVNYMFQLEKAYFSMRSRDTVAVGDGRADRDLLKNREVSSRRESEVWDASTGMGFSQHMEHQRRAWSVDFSRVDPTKFASGSDDCSVKLWCTNERRSTGTILSPANVCCVQFSPFSSHLLAFGSADYKIYGYDLRHARIPWCTLTGHEKAVSYVKFVNSETLVSASTDNTLKLWDLNKTSLSGLSLDACHLTFSGHTNKKHFVGLSVHDGYIACGSESNEVFAYCRSLPMPITSYKFSPLDPVVGHEAGEDNGLFVSSVCWRSKSNMVVAANSIGSIRLLQLV
ncbi:hypothetical protein Cgig2_030405 [Carnegiea gigantea]|uniref:Protein kinase domain-containing protein n=1 Tax=Carnegiea gigantea TaxID=171969 RepID=A0A9Q1KHZ8_9CARY|nr:hypothetical protein Cgig2_030405 [Carnegiea gigantea]